jgi:hypothetical protein
MLKVDADADEDGVGGDDAANALRCLVATENCGITLRKLRKVMDRESSRSRSNTA